MDYIKITPVIKSDKPKLTSFYEKLILDSSIDTLVEDDKKIAKSHMSLMMYEYISTLKERGQNTVDYFTSKLYTDHPEIYEKYFNVIKECSYDRNNL